MRDEAEAAIGSVPPALREGLRRYLDARIQPGGFLTAVLCNDLREALLAADPDSRAGLFDLVMWLYNFAPFVSWGSHLRVARWLAGQDDDDDPGT